MQPSRSQQHLFSKATPPPEFTLAANSQVDFDHHNRIVDQQLKQKTALQKRLYEVGQGAIHGKKGLPGISAQFRASLKADSSSVLSNKFKKQPMLVPANIPLKPKLTFRGAQLSSRGMRPPSQLRSSRLSMDRNERLFTMDDEVQHIQEDNFVDGDSDAPNMMTLGPGSQKQLKKQASQPKLIPKLNLMQLNKGNADADKRHTGPNFMNLADLPRKTEEFRATQIQSGLPKMNAVPKRNLLSSRSQVQLGKLNTDRARVTQAGITLESFTNVTIASKREEQLLKSPQFQKPFNLAPYQRKDAALLTERGGSQVKRLQTLKTIENQAQQTARELGVSQKGSDMRSLASKSTLLVSHLTGVKTSLPLGPSMSSLRSFSRQKIETQIQMKRVQSSLSKMAKMKILQKKEEDQQDLLDSRNIPQKRLDTATSQADSRMALMKQKLKMQQVKQEQIQDLISDVRKSSSRQNIRPGQQEATDESIRFQLLIGKLRKDPETRKLPFYDQSAHSSKIPLIMSDQLSYVSSQREQLQKQAMEAEQYKSNEPLNDNVIKKKSQVISKLRKPDQLKDYKPHDYEQVEDSPLVKVRNKSISEEEVPLSFAPSMLDEPRETVSETQKQLDQIILNIQKNKQLEEGYFIYLRKNPDGNNPYDLIPFKFEDFHPQANSLDLSYHTKRSKSNDAQLDTSRAAQNLYSVENYYLKREQNRPQSTIRQAFKSQYHHDKKPYKMRQSYEGLPINQKSKLPTEQEEQNRYYTLSQKGITSFLNNEPVDFIQIDAWLAERAQFNFISQKKFFSKFKTWKILRKWRRNIISAKREVAAASLRSKLFFADPVFSDLLLQHRFKCKELEKLRVIDLTQVNREPFSIVDFQQWQMVVRDTVQQKIRRTSDESRNLFRSKIDYVLDELRESIQKQEEAEEKDEITNKIDTMFFKKNRQNQNQTEYQLIKQIEKMESSKVSSSNPNYEILGFKKNLKFESRSLLRDACKKFLRLSFLLDFIALESLQNIFLLSIHDCIAKLEDQVSQEVTYDLASSKIENIQQQQQAQQQSSKKNKDGKKEEMQMKEIPLFFAECLYKEFTIPSQNYYTDIISVFELPPLGRSTKEDFNPMVHMEIEPEEISKESDGSSESEANLEESIDSMANKIKVKKVKDLHKLWLNIQPDQHDLFSLLSENFSLGFDCLKNFERWSMHADLKPYDSILEPWDYRSYERWEPPQEKNELYLNCDDWLRENPYYVHLEDNLEALINEAVSKIEVQFEQFEPYLFDYWVNQQISDFQIIQHERFRNPTDILPILLGRFVAQDELFNEFVPQSKDLGLFRVKFTILRNHLTPQPKNLLSKLKGILPRMVKTRVESCKKWLDEHTQKLRMMPSNVDEYVRQIQTLDYIEENFQSIKDKIKLNDQIFEILDKFDLPSREDKQARFIDEAYHSMNQLNQTIYETKDKADRRKDLMKKKILNKIPKLNARVEEFNGQILDLRFLKIEGSEPQDVMEQLLELEKEFEAMEKKKNNIQIYQKTMDMGVISQFQNVQEAKILLQYRLKLWTSIYSWKQNMETWQQSKFEEVNVDQILEQATQQQKIALQCERNLPQESTAVHYLKRMVFDFKETMPIVEALGNKYLKEEHWDDIKKILDIPNFPLEEKQFTLGQLVQLNVAQHADDIIQVSVTATQENNLRQQLEQLRETWQKLDFDLVKHKDREAYKLVNIDHIQTILDESLQISSSIVGSRYVARLQAQAQDMQDRLTLIFETLEQWRECQRNWLYLENIFSSADIRKQRPRDFMEYEHINKNWVKLMKQTFIKRSVRAQCSQSRQKLNDFIKWNATMDRIQKNLEDYLEDKREAFSRFYFISNDEMLNILANQADLKAIQKQITKCFENLNTFILEDQINMEKKEARRTLKEQQMKASMSIKSNLGNLKDSEIYSETDSQSEAHHHLELNEIYGINSHESERLRFRKVLKIRGQGVEIWMKSLEDLMVLTIQQKVKEAYNKFYDDSPENDRDKWVLNHVGQAVSVVDLITWTESTEMALNDMDENPFALEDQFTQVSQQLIQLTAVIRGQFSPVQRRILVALITQDVHARDIVEELWRRDTQSVFDFMWQKQLRYYLEDEYVLIRQVNTQILYAFEYMGPTTRLVITPLTDKCWITITGALHIKLGAAPAGPAGTGKTESTKDLAKACGIYCVVMNCSDQIEYTIMAKLFSGLVQSGAWTCLDEFNRINIEVLSVIAQQLQDIKLAKIQNKQQFYFNEKVRPLRHQCGVFITMNPGYAGRTELPDNLKVLFRPVSMMIPNYGLIAEIMLYAEGFENAKQLSTKMVQLYKLASEQLSQQDHYDFGLRAVKSVLVTAGNLKRAQPNLDESLVLINAMRDSNIPKFLADDLPLFTALIEDLFPGLESEKKQDQGIVGIVSRAQKTLGLEQSQKQAEKVIQLLETQNVRFGVMIVGPTGGGKSTILKILQQSFSSIIEPIKKVKIKVINPKSISMGELYGEQNLDSQEWTDGLASKTLRKFVTKASDDQQNWCVFDGPVDALWIENMNTVLDDNMTLCLANGERIKLNLSMRILFEVQDLAMASPATVSRCGMVYVTPSELGWRSYFYSWRQSFLAKKMEAEKAEFVSHLFDMFVDLTFQKLEKYRGNEVMETNQIQNVQCLCNFLEHFLIEKRIQEEDRKELWQKQINSVFALALIWGIGLSFDKSVHRYLDNIFRDFFGKLHFPPKETVFQYYYSLKERMFKHWDDQVNEFQTRIEAPYDQLFVPTVDTIFNSRLLEILMDKNKKVFFTGCTGSGKSIIVKEYIKMNESKHNYMSILLNFSAQTSSEQVQSTIEGKLVKKRGKKILGAKGNQNCVIFVDDINMPKLEVYGAQPPIEFLRLLLDKGIIYDRPLFFKKVIDHFKIICAGGPPGGGRSKLSPRFLRHFHIINVPGASEEILTQIFETIILQFLRTNLFSDDVRKCGNIAVAATIDMYTQFNKTMLPIPSRFHYLFNIRDVTKVFQGILMTAPSAIPDSKVFARLWLHECQRVFHDRLIDEADRRFFKDLAMELLTLKFKEKYTEEDLFLTDFTEGKIKTTFSMITNCDFENKLYDEVRDPARLIKVLEDKMIDYNFTFPKSTLNLIFFEYAIDHLTRVSRILNQPRGNALLIGVSGCGKQSLSKLAAFIQDIEASTIKLVKNYRAINFREDLKEVLLNSGCDRKKNVFILSDAQILQEDFLEDINCILNTGEIANLYEKEDYERMGGSLARIMKQRKILPSFDNIYQTYLNEMKLYFHLILCMSPLGNSLRVRCRNFPSMVTCCSLDWFDNWPEQALETVSQQYFQQKRVFGENEQARYQVSALFPLVHRSVEALSERFFEENKRNVYVTPKSYLDALSNFEFQANHQQKKLQTSLSRLQNGISKLELTNEQIKQLQVTLSELVPQLEQQNVQANEQVEQIEKQTELVLQSEQETEKEARVVKHEAKIIEKYKEEADMKLERAKPALLEAEKAVNQLSKDDITELKKVNNPIAAVKLSLECTLLYLGYKQFDWAFTQKVLADMKFLDKLKTYEKESIPEITLQKVRALTRKEDFNLEKMTRASKAAGGLAKWCVSIRDYAEALIIVRPLQAKQEEMTKELRVAQQAVAKKEADLQEIKNSLQELKDKFQNTQNFIEELNQEKSRCERRLVNASKLLDLLSNEGQRWKQEIQVLKQQTGTFLGNVFLSSAQTNYLGPFSGSYRDEALQMWMTNCKTQGLDISENYSLVATLGDPVSIRNWGIFGLPDDSVSVDNGIFTMRSQKWPMLIDPQFQANNWLKRMFRDPGCKQQFQVLKALKSDTLSAKQLMAYFRSLEVIVGDGGVLLIEDMREEIDPNIDQVVSKSVYKEDGIHKLKIGDRPVEYNDKFRLFMTTKIANPHFLPEVSTKLQLVNFTVTFEGLNEQLLAETVKILAPQVEKQRDRLVIEISEAKNQQFAMQTSILTSLAESNQDTILDNEELIETLKTSKEKSHEIQVSLHESEKIEQEVRTKRDQFRDIAIRGSILYFVVVSLSAIDPMYQYSLAYVIRLFVDTIRTHLKKLERQFKIEHGLSLTPESSSKSQISEELEEEEEEHSAASPRARGMSSTYTRLRNADATIKSSKRMSMTGSVVSSENFHGEPKSLTIDVSLLGPIEKILSELIDCITKSLYVNICRGLFEQHKAIFSFLMATSIFKNQGLISEESYQLLLRGPSFIDKTKQPPFEKHHHLHSIINEAQWDLAYAMQTSLPRYFPSLLEQLDVYVETFKQFALVEIGESEHVFNKLPLSYSESLLVFEKLLLIKLLKPQVFVQAFHQYIEIAMGPFFAVSPLTSVDNLFQASDPHTPIIFILSQGADPNEGIVQYAERLGFGEKLFQKSLGQGQEATATKLIEDGIAKGYWILLQNCHLFKSWMPRLEEICGALRERKVHSNFRLILTSMPVPYFPSSILQNGVKMTTEPPSGLKSNLKRIFTSIVNEDTYYLSKTYGGKKVKDKMTEEIQLLFRAMSSESSTNLKLTSQTTTTKINQLMQRKSLNLDIDRRFDLSKCWRSMLFGLAFFHAVIQERKRFGSIGWNIRYEFNDSDLETSIKMLQNFLFESEDIPWDSIQFMTGHINYGGRVTDDNDRRILIAIMEQCFSNQIINEEYVKQPKQRGSLRRKKKAIFSFFGQQRYQIPPKNEKLEEVIEYVELMPNQDPPEIFGMHSNANITFQQQEGRSILNQILNVKLEPMGKTAASSILDSSAISSSHNSGASKSSIEKAEATAQTNDQIVKKMAEELYANRPQLISSDEHQKDIFKRNAKGLLHCFSIVLLQEKDRYNRLLEVVHSSLTQLIQAIMGQVLMSTELELMYDSLLKNQVPKNWEAVSFNSNKTLASWYKDLHERIDFMKTWMKKGHPKAYWLSGFFFPHGFMTGILQQYARKHLKAIDFLKFKFEFLSKSKDHLNIETHAEDGVYVYGLFIECGKWSSRQKCLVEQEAGAMASRMPIIHFQPFEVVANPKAQQQESQSEERKSEKKEDPSDRYSCPVYKTSSRAGVLSTTGQSTNFILNVDIPTDKEDSSHWTLRGTALVSMLDD